MKRIGARRRVGIGFLVVAVAAAGLTVVTPQAAHAACSSIPSTADPNVLKTVYEVGTRLSANDRVMLAAFEAGWVESRMNNLPCGDQDSLGVFQQRPSQGWGTPAQILDVSFASNSFFTRAIPLAASNPSWSAGQVAQGVQRSAFPARYDQAEATARALIEQARQLVTPPPPSVADGLDATSWGAGRMDLFARSDNRRLVHRWFTGGRWSGWEDLGGTLTSDPAAVAMTPNRLDVFARGGENQLVHKYYSSGRWSTWENLGETLTSAPDVVSWANGRLDVFARGTGNRLIHRWFTGGRWSAWESLGGTLSSAPTAATWGDKRLDVFARGMENQLVHRYFAGNSWSAWEHLGGTLTSAPAATTSKVNRLDVFARGGGDRLLHRWFANDAWSGWEDMGGGAFASPPAAESWSPDRFDLFGVDRSNRLLHRWFTGGRWSGWESLGAMP